MIFFSPFENKPENEISRNASLCTPPLPSSPPFPSLCLSFPPSRLLIHQRHGAAAAALHHTSVCVASRRGRKSRGFRRGRRRLPAVGEGRWKCVPNRRRAKRKHGAAESDVAARPVMDRFIRVNFVQRVCMTQSPRRYLVSSVSAVDI